jgi:4-amino-4-deoxy-L-arabinose transferase-like glycosyltransferase
MVEKIAPTDAGNGTRPEMTGSVPPPVACKDLAFGAVVALSGLLLFWSLDGRLLWQDEAETALLAKSILKHGVPIGFDGTNVVSQEASKEFVADARLPAFLWRWSPWVQFYIAAGSFALLGPNTLSARLPFASLGLVAVCLTYIYARRLSGSRAIARLSALYLVTSVPFLLHVRQARWCAPAYCLSLGVLLSLEGLAAGRKYSRLAFVASGVLLFYTNYFVAIGLLASSLTAAVLVKGGPALLRRLASAIFAVVVSTLPGAYLFQITSKSKRFELFTLLDHMNYYSGSYFTFMLPMPLLALILWMIVSKRSAPELTAKGTSPVVMLLVITVLYVAYITLGPWVEFRYLTLLLPTTSILLAVATDRVRRMNPALGIALLSALIFTDLVHMAPLGYVDTAGTHSADRFLAAGPVSFPLLGFLYEITHHFDAPEFVLADLLNRSAKRTDIVLTTYDVLPLQFYTGLRVAGGLQGRELPNDPDWLIRRRWIVSGEPGKDHDVDIFIDKLIIKSKYNIESIHHKDHMLGTNPDPKHHLFATPDSGPRLIVLKRVR